jgi:hypothetical protein
VLADVERHREHLRTSGELDQRRRSHLRLRVETILKERVVAAADRVLGLEREIERGFEQRLDPYRVADRLFAGVVAGESDGVDALDTGPAGLTEERMA